MHTPHSAKLMVAVLTMSHYLTDVDLNALPRKARKSTQKQHSVTSTCSASSVVQKSKNAQQRNFTRAEVKAKRVRKMNVNSIVKALVPHTFGWKVGHTRITLMPLTMATLNFHVVYTCICMCCGLMDFFICLQIIHSLYWSILHSSLLQNRSKPLAIVREENILGLAY